MISRYWYSLLFLLCSYSVLAQSWEAKVDTSLLEKAKIVYPFEMLVVMKAQADLSTVEPTGAKIEKATQVHEKLTATQSTSQIELLNMLAEKRVPHQSLFIVNLIWVLGDGELLKNIAQREDVAWIAANPTIAMESPFVEESVNTISPRNGIEWGILKIRANEVWDLGYTGKGAVVGGQDTGYDWLHPSIVDKYRGKSNTTIDHNYNWHDAIREIHFLNAPQSINPCGLDIGIPCDDNNHGTHTMGTMVGSTGDNQIGVAPDAKWIGCRNMERGWGTPFTYLECFQWFLAPTNINNQNPDPSKAPHVINNSWGCPPEEGCTPSNFALLEIAVNNLKTSGVVVVVSAGNDGRNCSTVNNPSAIFENSFSVGASQITDSIANFSSRGPVLVDGSRRIKPNVVAPGVSVRSAIKGNGYANFSGTSMAGPHVAGAVALMISANPDLAGQVELIETILEETAVPYNSSQNCGTANGVFPNNIFGYGRIDALAAVKKAISLKKPRTDAKNTVFKIAPNPFAGQVEIIANEANARQLRLFDAAGSLLLIMNWTSDRLLLDLNTYPNGVYWYEIIENNSLSQGKLVKIE
jgi:subtilisin family serine protease